MPLVFLENHCRILPAWSNPRTNSRRQTKWWTACFANELSATKFGYRDEWWSSICFVRAWKIGFLASYMAPWLSHLTRMVGICGRAPITVESSQWRWRVSACKKPSSKSIRRSQTASCVPFHNAPYLLSVEERLTVGCCLLEQGKGPLAILKRYPPVLLQVSSQAPQSASV